MEKLYTVSQVAKETGVTIKTLHYYQKINLLLPTKIGENGYRYYSENDINFLQEILLYRTMGFSLEEIKELLLKDDHSTRIQRLEHQLVVLNDSIEETKIMINTVNASLVAERQGLQMKHEDMFEGVNKEDDSIYRSMQNVTVILSKPFTFIFFIFGISLFISGTHTLIVGSKADEFIFDLFFTILGFITAAISFYNLFFVSTKKLLNTINKPYIKK